MYLLLFRVWTEYGVTHVSCHDMTIGLETHKQQLLFSELLLYCKIN